MQETWRPLINYEISYHISSLGRIKSLPRNGTSVKGGIRNGASLVIQNQKTSLTKGQQTQDRALYENITLIGIDPEK